ncbi:hypothetical protein EYZ11_001876 [Aspergillus tanneri]|uniref:ORC6 first cyclin-like domain-containing protein n=1 Tax=Aspergillus tanneri TaxID=1220188 RepID=A0A4S3JS73_9EURO|nr:hypothetical protein EYZ11_001876 [Aspergillus tanneri]
MTISDIATFCCRFQYCVIPVEQALGTLLPTHVNDLPPELLSLALSLVAQSRSFSSSLKPEEEIARPYACAEIACRR